MVNQDKTPLIYMSTGRSNWLYRVVNYIVMALESGQQDYHVPDSGKSDGIMLILVVIQMVYYLFTWWST